MLFNSVVGQELSFEQDKYIFVEHPNSPGMVHVQEGRRAYIYRILLGKQYTALKVFKHKFQTPEIAEGALALAHFQDLPGLRVAQRAAILPDKHKLLVDAEPSLAYAILMPWIEGENWSQFVWDRRRPTALQSLQLAKALTNVVAGLEARGIAHCDLASSNFIFSSDFRQVELVDIEELFAAGLKPPGSLPAGTPGYAPAWTSKGIWAVEADRYALAILVCEMLGWQFVDVRAIRHGESYFQPDEIGRPCSRLATLEVNLRKIDPKLVELLTAVWQAKSMDECPPVSAWKAVLDALPERTGLWQSTSEPRWPVRPPALAAPTVDGQKARMPVPAIPAPVPGAKADADRPAPRRLNFRQLSTPGGIMTTALVVALVLVVGLVATLAVSKAPPVHPLLAFASSRAGSYDIYVLDVSQPGTIIDLTSNHTGLDADPTWSPDGKQIAFDSDRSGPLEIFVMNADGTNVIQVTHDNGVAVQPNWSPVGSQIAYASKMAGNLDIFVVDTNGSNRRQLTNGSSNDYDPKWSPDGRQILFESTRDGQSRKGTGELYVMNADGSNAHRLMSNIMNVQSANWAPDGQHIVFGAKPDPSGGFQIYLTSLAGADVQRLSNIITNESYPAFSPDGQQIVFVSDRTGNNNLFVMRADGTAQTQLTNTGRDNSAPLWRPMP